mgnify:CR=1 FL=1
MPRKAKSAASKARQKKLSNADYQNEVKQKKTEAMEQLNLLGKCCEPADDANAMLYSDAVKLDSSANTLPHTKHEVIF